MRGLTMSGGDGFNGPSHPGDSSSGLDTRRTSLGPLAYRPTLRRSADLLVGEPQLSEYADSTHLPAFEIASGEASARRELVSSAEKGLRWVAAVVADQLVGRRRRETVLREELIWPKPVVFLYRAHHVIATNLTPVRNMRHRRLLCSVGIF
jgi:hypothetical protein